MALNPAEFTRNHYNKHVKNISTEQAMRERNEGAALPLKKFHNEIKRSLIRRFAYNVDALLDLCCGRGGDLHKWKDAQVKYVKGIDLSPKEIEEAERRYMEIAADPKVSLVAEFECTDKLGVAPWEEAQQYDVVTCMFSMHYFFFAEDALKRFLSNVALNLKPGGYFIGTVPDGKRVLAQLNRQKMFDSPMLKLTQRWEGNYSTFGCGYSCSIADTVTQGHGASKGSYEFLVFTSPVVIIAATLGLKPVLAFEDPYLESMFDEADADKPFKHFKPSFANSHPSLELASSLFAAFVFQKVGDGKVSLPPLPPAEQRRGGGGPRGGRGPPRGEGGPRHEDFRQGGRGQDERPAKRMRPEDDPRAGPPYGHPRAPGDGPGPGGDYHRGRHPPPPPGDVPGGYYGRPGDHRGPPPHDPHGPHGPPPHDPHGPPPHDSHGPPRPHNPRPTGRSGERQQWPAGGRAAAPPPPPHHSRPGEDHMGPRGLDLEAPPEHLPPPPPQEPHRAADRAAGSQRREGGPHAQRARPGHAHDYEQDGPAPGGDPGLPGAPHRHHSPSSQRGPPPGSASGGSGGGGAEALGASGGHNTGAGEHGRHSVDGGMSGASGGSAAPPASRLHRSRAAPHPSQSHPLASPPNSRGNSREASTHAHAADEGDGPGPGRRHREDWAGEDADEGAQHSGHDRTAGWAHGNGVGPGGGAFKRLPQWDEPKRNNPSRPDPEYEPPAPAPLQADAQEQA